MLLLDEPTSALDPTATEKKDEEFHRSLADRLTIIVTWLAQAARIATGQPCSQLNGELVERAHRTLFSCQHAETTRYVAGLSGTSERPARSEEHRKVWRENFVLRRVDGPW